jgi:CRP-like cAMP-binding protein
VFIIQKGRVRVLQDRKRPQEVSELGSGTMFGEMATLEGMRRQATVRALEDTYCLMLSQGNFGILPQREAGT